MASVAGTSLLNDRAPGMTAVDGVAIAVALPAWKDVPSQNASDPSVRLTYSPTAQRGPVPIPRLFKAARFAGTSLSKLPGAPAVTRVEGLGARPGAKAAPSQNASVPFARVTYSPGAQSTPVPIPRALRVAMSAGVSPLNAPGEPAVTTVEGLVARPGTKVTPLQKASAPSARTT